MPAKEKTVVRIWKKYDNRQLKELHFHKFLELRGDRPVGVSLRIMDCDKRDAWTDPGDFVPLDDRTCPIIDEIKALEEQRAGLESEITALYEKLNRFRLVKPRQ